MSGASMVVVVSGLVALGWSSWVIMPASSALIITLRKLHEAARRADVALFKSAIEPNSPIQGGRFIHRQIGFMLKADLTLFGADCQALQLEARRLDRRCHYGLIPIGLFALGCALWYGAGP
jgi:hypothetical protein